MFTPLYAITDGSKTTLEDLETALRAGIRLVQLREKSLTEDEYVARAESALEICRRYGAKLIINDSVAVCRRVGADGVHLGQSDIAPRIARAELGADAMIGVTAKTVTQARTAAAAGADYLGCGAIFPSETKRDAIRMSAETLRDIVENMSIPVYAIGGITRENVTSLRGTGIFGIAVVSGIFGGNITENVAALLEETRLL